MKFAKTILILCVVCCASSLAAADIIDLEDQDGTGYFKDTATGRTWMDVDTFLNMSYEKVAAGIAATEFHIASYDELMTLQSSIAPATEAEFDSFAAIIGSYDTGVTRYVDGTPVSETIMSGWYDDSSQPYNDPDKAGMAWIYNWQRTWHTSPDNFLKDSRLTNTGAWVVTAAPEPVSSVLFILGGAGLLSRRFRA